MRPWSVVGWLGVGVLAGGVACGGRVEPVDVGDAGPGWESVDTPEDIDASADVGAPSSSALPTTGAWPESCAALADCCGEFTGAVASKCNALASGTDDAACAAQVTVFQQQGVCEGQ